MADWWETLDVIPYSLIGIPSLLSEEVRMSVKSVNHVSMGTSTIIWDHIGARPILPLTIQKPLHPLQLSLRPQVSPIKPRRSGPSLSSQKV